MTRTLLVLSVGWLVAGNAPARAGIIHTTFDPGLTYPEPFGGFEVSDADGPFGYISTAVPYTTSGQIPLRLDRVYSAGLGRGFVNPVYSEPLYSSTGGPVSTPDPPLAVLNRELHREDLAGVSAAYRHTPGAEVLLAPNAEYWLVAFIAPADAVPGLDGIWYAHDTTLPAHTIAYRFGPSDPWFREDVPNDFFGRPLFQVEATAVPEPTSLAAFAVLGLGMGLVRHVRRPLASA